ncbi:hypothetical protein H7K36_16540 [Mycolicibacterium litorale]|nr:hypothetical protein [Mycolicibacterium litorale]MCV7416917.1 hypothetical protein [Mycolicibacterium litorale]TDY04701.1 hypothetical protein BCL50_3478 [Mycolicibacterium litorale]
MDLVLGVSMTSTALRFVLVEGATGDGATLDSGTLHMPVSAASADALISAVLGEGQYAAVPGVRPRAVGVTWTEAVAEEAATLVAALTARGAQNVVALSPAESAAALAAGLGDLTAQDDLAVCVAEPDAALVAVVTADAVHVDQVAHDGAASLARRVQEAVDSSDVRPEALYVLGSADDVDAVVGELAGRVTAPVLSAAEADLALARGAAVASAQGSVGVDAPMMLAQVAAEQPKSWRTWRIPALTSVLVAAVVTFVVSLSVALGLQLTPQMRSDDAATQQVASSSDQPKAVSAPAAEALPKAAPKPAAPPPPPPQAPPAPAPAVAPVVDVPEAPAPAPEAPPVIEPVYDAPVAAPPPAPVYVPPAPPVYVPPAPAVAPQPAYVPPAPVAPAYTQPQPGYVPPVPPQPRLRDRIIERLPIINRFHEPQY